MLTGRRFGWFSILTVMIGMPALAQGPAPVLITVHPSAYYSPWLDNQANEKIELDRIPGAASVVDNDDWNGTRAETIKDIVDYTPGVYAQPRNGGESQRLSIRGSGLARSFQGRGILVLQDGIPINTADGTFEFPVIDPWLVDHAKIYRGANALEFGASTLGGAIDLTTPNGLTGDGYTLRGEAGSFETNHALASIGKTFGAYDVYAAASNFYQDGFRDNNAQHTERFSANLGWHNDTITQRFYASQSSNEAQIPGAISLAQIQADPERANPTNVTGRYRRDLDVTRIGHRLQWQAGPDTLETTLYYMNRQLDNPVTTYILEDGDDIGARVKYTRAIGENRLILGLNTAWGWQDERRYVNLQGRTGAHILDRNLYAFTGEAYAQYEQALVGQLFGIASLQSAYAERRIAQSFPTVARQKTAYTGINPRIGLRDDITTQSHIFANLSRSFEPPALDELSGGNAPGFKQIDAQTATTAEFGGRFAWRGLHADAAFYHSWLQDEFVNYQFPNGTSNTINADKTIHRGIELGLDGDLARDSFTADDAFNLRAAATWNDFRFDGDPLYGDNRLPGVPEYYTRAEILYRHPSGLSFGPNVEWSPESYPIDVTNSFDAGSYAIYGARASWQKTEDMSFYLEGRNLADRHYAATTNVIPNASGTDSRSFFPGEGRAFYAGFRIRL